MLRKTVFGLFGLLVLAPLMIFGQKMDRTKPLGTAMMSRMNIIDAAKAAGTFKILVQAAEASGWDAKLKGKESYTIFAPTDEAFAKLPAGTIENLLKPENNEMLVKILTYHIIKGNVPAEEVMKMNKVKSVQGQEFNISSKDGIWMANEAVIVKTDIVAANGIIHVIDTVLMPK